jgi:cytochrome c biogenesis protein
MDIRVRHRATQEETTHRIRSGAAEPLPNGGFFRVVRFSSCFQDRGPVAVIEVNPDRGESFILPVFYNNSTMTGIHNQTPFRFTLSAFRQPRYTGLQVNRDPGLWLVWSGFILMAAGLFMTFAFSHQRIWVSIAPEGALIRIQVWGESQRHPIAFKRFFGRLCTLLATELEAPQKEKE